MLYHLFVLFITTQSSAVLAKYSIFCAQRIMVKDVIFSIGNLFSVVLFAYQIIF